MNEVFGYPLNVLAFVALGACALVGVALGDPAAAKVHAPLGEVDPAMCEPCHREITRLLSQPQQQPIGASYTSSTLDAAVGAPAGISQWCLGCHDGVQASDAGQAQGLGVLSDDHPVSFRFNESLAAKDPGLHSPHAPSGLGGTIESDLLVNGRVECTSCHVFHQLSPPYPEYPKLLRMKETRLCLTCHDK